MKEWEEKHLEELYKISGNQFRIFRSHIDLMTKYQVEIIDEEGDTYLLGNKFKNQERFRFDTLEDAKEGILRWLEEYA